MVSEVVMDIRLQNFLDFPDMCEYLITGQDIINNDIAARNIEA